MAAGSINARAARPTNDFSLKVVPDVPPVPALSPTILEVAVSFLIDLLLEVIFGGGWSKETPKPSNEFILDESSASIAGFFALLAVVPSVPVLLPAWRGRVDGAILTALTVSVGFAGLAILAGRRTFRVTKRGWVVAHVALWTAWLTLLLDFVVLAMLARVWMM